VREPEYLLKSSNRIFELSESCQLLWDFWLNLRFYSSILALKRTLFGRDTDDRDRMRQEREFIPKNIAVGGSRSNNLYGAHLRRDFWATSRLPAI
jgi:hypothetical protein